MAVFFEKECRSNSPATRMPCMIKRSNVKLTYAMKRRPNTLAAGLLDP